MKSILVLVCMAVLSITAKANTSEELKSKTIKKQACEFLKYEYEGNNSDYDYYGKSLESFGIEITLESCQKMEAIVTRKKTQELGSKTYIVGLELTLSDENYTCDLRADRRVSVTLNKQDQPVILVSDWRIEEDRDPVCYVKAAPSLISFNIEKDSAKLRKIDSSKLPAKLYVPDYLELGEPDDGTYGADYEAFELVENGVVIGFILDYWYANTEGDWANRYTLKYNENGLLLGNLIAKDYYDLCDYPYFDKDEDNSYCSEN